MGYLYTFSPPILVILAIYYTLTTFQTWKRRQSLKTQHNCLPPPKYPHKDPFLGTDLFRANIQAAKESRLLATWLQRFQQHGDTFSANFLGAPAICTVDPRNLQTILSTNFHDFGVQPLRRDATLPFLGEGVFTMDGVFWERSRALLRPTFGRANVANLEAFEGNFVKFLDLLPKGGETVDLKPLLCKLVYEKTPTASQEFLDAFHYAQQGTGRRLQLGKLAFLYRDRKWRESVKVAHAFADRYVDKAIEYRRSRLAAQDAKVGDMDEAGDDEPGKRYVLLHEMAMQTDNRENLRNQIMHVFLAGHESSAISIGNALFQLARHPLKWERLREEVLAGGEEPLTVDRLKGMDYLQGVVKETLRLYPVASMMTLMTYTDTILPTGGGPSKTSPIFVKKGTKITTSSYVVGRIAQCYQPDPEVFRPERWEDLKPGIGSYIPFGYGPRTCPAKNLAEVEIAYVLARMAKEWKEVECRDEVVEWVEELRVSTSSRNGTVVGLVRG
ncbi:hypothetical protein HYFRA_00000631 [Hymenoscyphus fraxineus]|uniref:Cytochrome P450 n=1 Tax=Hymenoscyphus fraxineus TaxID=746836 RepID=A0A9N9L474_9HELO|nr:hypothetical protein HYFRA_00000631 [Hymenoscyphus fraxineus]